jgi:hypothetical protein
MQCAQWRDLPQFQLNFHPKDEAREAWKKINKSQKENAEQFEIAVLV